jgi:hypothetical protein
MSDINKSPSARFVLAKLSQGVIISPSLPQFFSGYISPYDSARSGVASAYKCPRCGTRNDT